MPEAAMPHCDSAVLHAPGECEYCDAYPSWQEARRMWRIAFTGHPPKDGELPCPSEVRRTQDDIEAWLGNRPSPTSPSDRPGRPGRPKMPPPDFGEDWWSAHSPTQLGRPNIPVLRRDLELMVREIVLGVLRDELKRDGGH